MKKLLLPLVLGAVVCFGGIEAAQAQRTVIVEKTPKRNLNDGYDKQYNKHRTKRVYVIENGRPIRREVFVDERGRYYRENGGQRAFVGRHFDSYPSKYFERDGRRRKGVTIDFN